MLAVAPAATGTHSADALVLTYGVDIGGTHGSPPALAARFDQMRWYVKPPSVTNVPVHRSPASTLPDCTAAHGVPLHGGDGGSSRKPLPVSVTASAISWLASRVTESSSLSEHRCT